MATEIKIARLVFLLRPMQKNLHPIGYVRAGHWNARHLWWRFFWINRYRPAGR